MGNSKMLHIRFPADVAARMDRVLKNRRMSRNEFVVAAVAEKIAAELRVQGLRETRGVLGPGDAPEWAAAPGSEWVRKVRQEEEEAAEWPT